MYLQCLSLGRLTARLPPASQRSLPCRNLSPSLQKEESQSTNYWKAITLLRGPSTQGKHPNSSRDSHFWQLFLRVKGTAGCSPRQWLLYLFRSLEQTAEWEGSSQLQRGIKLSVTTLSFVPGYAQGLKQTLIIFYSLEKGMAKPNSPRIVPNQQILEQSTKYTLTDTHIDFIFHSWDQTLCVANSSWVLLCMPFLLLGKGQTSHVQRVRPNSLLRQTGTSQPT